MLIGTRSVHFYYSLSLALVLSKRFNQLLHQLILLRFTLANVQYSYKSNQWSYSGVGYQVAEATQNIFIETRGVRWCRTHTMQNWRYCNNHIKTVFALLYKFILNLYALVSFPKSA